MEQNITGNIIPGMDTQIDMQRWRVFGAYSPLGASSRSLQGGEVRRAEH